MNKSLNGKKILISAGASGIGWATAKICLSKGATVYICDIETKYIAKIKKQGDVCSLISDDVSWKINSKLKDGEYKVGIRPHNITTYKEGSNSLEISGKVLISELSGSESLIHFTNGDLNWVSLSNGIHQKNVGEQTKLFMNSDEFLYFDETNKLVNNV